MRITAAAVVFGCCVTVYLTRAPQVLQAAQDHAVLVPSGRLSLVRRPKLSYIQLVTRPFGSVAEAGSPRLRFQPRLEVWLSAFLMDSGNWPVVPQFAVVVRTVMPMPVTDCDFTLPNPS